MILHGIFLFFDRDGSATFAGIAAGGDERCHMHAT